MRFSIGQDKWCLFDGGDEPGSESARFRGNESAALQWLEQFRGDSAAMRALGDQLSKQAAGVSLNDGEVLRKVAAHLAGGRWNVRRGSQGQADGGGPNIGPPGIGPGVDADTVEFGPPFPLEYRRKYIPPSGGSEAPHQPLFPNDADLKAIADGQKRAAERGAALCEECAKAQSGSGH